MLNRHNQTLIIGLICFIFLTACTLTAITLDSREASPEIRSVWVASLAPGIRSPDQVRSTVDALRSANLNTLIAQIRREGMTYFQSDLEPRATTIEASSDWDPLADIVEVAHDTSGGGQRLDVYAWFNVYAVGNQRHLVGATPTPIAEAHPEWYSRTPGGERTAFLDPGVPAVIDHFAALVAECLDRYEVDGVNLDFVRYPEEEAGYNPIAIERFQRLTGRTDVPALHDPEWAAFRRDQVEAMVRRVMVTVLEHRPEAMLSVCAVGFWAPPEEGQTFADTAPYRQVHQDWEGWAQRGVVDVVTRMGYKREHIPEHAAHFRGWADFSRNLQDESGRLITVGIGAYFNQADAVITQIREAQARGLGISIFSYHRPQGDAGDTGLTGPDSPMWRRIAEEAYPTPAPTPRPVWREGLGTVAGFLRDADGDPLDTATVRLAGTDIETRSDGSGFYAFLNLDPGTYRLESPDWALDGTEVIVTPNRVVWTNH